MTYDVVTMGETMLRFTPSGKDRIEQSREVEMHVGGSESNTAVGLARLGCSAAWLSRLPNNPLGAHVCNSIRGQGVDTTFVQWTDEQRLGLYFMERGETPRGSEVFYDRSDSAMCHFHPQQLPESLFSSGAAKCFHSTGITAGISDIAQATLLRAAQLSKEAGWLVSFDLNYRARLWTAEEAYRGCLPLMQIADFLIMPLRDARQVCGIREDDAESCLKALRAQFPEPVLVLTMGSEGAAAAQPNGEPIHQPAFPTRTVERLGGGDAFSAGLLASWLETPDLPRALRWAAAAAAIKYTIPGDLPLLDRTSVQRLAEENVGRSDIAR